MGYLEEAACLLVEAGNNYSENLLPLAKETRQHCAYYSLALVSQASPYDSQHWMHVLHCQYSKKGLFTLCWHFGMCSCDMILFGLSFG